MLMFILYEVSMPVFANAKASWVNFCCFKVCYMNTLTGIKTYSMIDDDKWFLSQEFKSIAELDHF